MFISPMLLHYSRENKPFNSSKHISELKLDGIRIIASCMDSLHFYTRNGNDVTSKFPELYDCPFPSGTIVDGEIIVADHRGRPDFEAMLGRFHSNKDKTPVTFCAFDIIRHRGIDVTGLPLLRRKELLEQAFEENKYYKKTRYIHDNHVDYFEIVKQNGLEGIVIKDVKSKYEMNRRSWAWQKVINWTYVEVYITAIRKEKFGWLTAIESDDGYKHQTGIIELGVTPAHKAAFEQVRNKLAYKEDQHFVYIEPLIQAKIKTRNWTKNGKLRSPVFVDFVASHE